MINAKWELLPLLFTSSTHLPIINLIVNIFLFIVFVKSQLDKVETEF